MLSRPVPAEIWSSPGGRDAVLRAGHAWPARGTGPVPAGSRQGSPPPPASLRLHIEAETFAEDIRTIVLPNGLGWQGQLQGLCAHFPFSWGNKICQSFCPQADVDASHPGAQAPHLRPGRSPEWVPRLPARPCQRSLSRPEGGLRHRELNGQVPVCAWQRG